MRQWLSALTVSFALMLPVATQALDIQRVVSPGGIEAWLVEEDAVPVIVLMASWEGGTASDPADKAGLANMASALFTQGAGEYAADAFQAKLDDIAAQLSFSANSDHFGVTLKTLSDKREEAFGLLELAVTSPRFDEDAVERVRAQIGTVISRNQERPSWIAGNAWKQAVYGDHPYARDSDGTQETLAAITQDDLRGFAGRTLARDNLKIAVVGPVSAGDLGALLDRTFGPLPEKAERVKVSRANFSPKGQVVVTVRDFPQSVAVFGVEGPMRRDTDFMPAFVMNHILGGGGFSSRLMEEVREKRGLAYSVSSQLYPRQHGSMLIGDVGTKNESVGDTLAIIRSEFSRLANDGVSEAELEDAKTYLTGSYPLRFASNGSIAGQLLGIQQEGLGIDYVERRNGEIEAVTREDISRVARRLLQPDNLVISVVGKPDLTRSEGTAAAE